MAETSIDTFPRDRAMDAAERLFARRGFASVTLREVGAELGLSHASLYYHFPGGKEELYVAVTQRTILRHGMELGRIIEETCCNLRARLMGVAHWLLENPPLDLIRMAESDMPALDPASARRLMELMHEQILLRMQNLLQEADEEGVIHCPNPALVGGALVGLIESFHSMPDLAVRGSRTGMAGEMIDILLRGLEYRTEITPGTDGAWNDTGCKEKS